MTIAATIALPVPGRAALVLERWDALLEAAFGQRLNPMRHLGALGFFFFWICCASGIWIYVGFDTSATGARESLADDAAGTFDRVREEEVRLEPGRVLVIDFEPGKGGIVLR